VDDKYLHVPAQENSTALNIMRLALANRPRRAKEEIEFTNVRIIILAFYPLFLRCLMTKFYAPRKRETDV
jgi:hypothetical protein